LRPSATLQLGESGFARLPRAVLPVGRHRVVRVGDEDDPRLEGDLLAAQTVRVTRTIPALVVVEDDLGDRIDPETVEHAEPDLRMALEDEALGVRELSRLLEDLLGNCEFPEIVKGARKARDVALLGVEPQPRGTPGSEVSDTLGMPAGVRVACVDGLRERRRRAVARGTVRTGRQPLELCQLDDVRPVEADTVLPV